MTSVLCTPVLGYLFTTLQPILSPRGPTPSLQPNRRQTCLVFAQVFHVNSGKERTWEWWEGREMQWRKRLEANMPLRHPKPETTAMTEISLIWDNYLEINLNLKTPDPEQKLTISKQRSNQIKIDWLVQSGKTLLVLANSVRRWFIYLVISMPL